MRLTQEISIRRIVYMVSNISMRSFLEPSTDVEGLVWRLCVYESKYLSATSKHIAAQARINSERKS
jgi:hypothetical protein